LPQHFNFSKSLLTVNQCSGILAAGNIFRTFAGLTYNVKQIYTVSLLTLKVKKETADMLKIIFNQHGHNS